MIARIQPISDLDRPGRAARSRPRRPAGSGRPQVRLLALVALTAFLLAIFSGWAYRSEADLLLPGVGDGAAVDDAVVARRLANEIALLTSPRVLDGALAETDGTRRADRRGLASARAEIVPGTDIVRVALDSSSDSSARALLHRLIDAYRVARAQVDESRVDDPGVAAAIDAMHVSAAAIQRQLDEFPHLRGVPLDDRRRDLVARATELERAIELIDVAIRASTARSDTWRSALEDLSETQVVAEARGHADPSVDLIRQRISELRLEESRLLENYDEHSRVVLAIREQIEDATSMLAAEGDRARITLGINELHQKAEIALLEESVELAALESRRSATVGQLEHTRSTLLALAGGQARVARLEQELTRQRERIARYRERLGSADLGEVAMAGAGVAVLQPPTPATRHLSVTQMWLLFVAIAALATAAWRAVRDDRTGGATPSSVNRADETGEPLGVGAQVERAHDFAAAGSAE